MSVETPNVVCVVHFLPFPIPKIGDVYRIFFNNGCRCFSNLFKINYQWVLDSYLKIITLF